MPLMDMDAFGNAYPLKQPALVPNCEWWHKAAGGMTFMIAKVGFDADICECVYLKYMHGVHPMAKPPLRHDLQVWAC